MLRVPVPLLVVVLSGCAWPWDAYRLAGEDAGELDAGPEVDAGPGRDGGPGDGGPATDAAMGRDAGPRVDGGGTDAGGEPGCNVGGVPGERCGPQRCTRPISASDRACCTIGACVASPDRPVAWAEFTTESPTIDAFFDPWYNLGTDRVYLSVVDPESGGAPAVTDMTAGFTAIWSDTHLYFVFQIVDDRLIDSPTTTYLNDDRVELTIDADPTDGVGPVRLILTVGRTAPESIGVPVTRSATSACTR